MKMTMKLLTCAAALLAAVTVTEAQTTNAAPSPQNFATSIIQYFGTINTNYQFQPFIIWTEGDYQNQVNFANAVDVSYDVYTTAAAYTGGVSFALELGMRNAGIAGTIADGHGGLQLAYNYYDTRIEGYGDAVYEDAFGGKVGGEFGIRALKKATPNTFFGLSLGFQVPTSGPSYPIVGVLAGATF